MLVAIRVTYAAGDARLVDEVSLSIRPGEIVALAGPNGAGKTTLLKLLSGELAPSEGSVFLNDVSIHDLKPAELAVKRAVVPQAAQLQFPFTAIEVVMLGATVPGFSSAGGDGEDAARLAMNAVGLKGYEHRNYAELSGGERQRVQIARALCQLDVSSKNDVGTSALLLDEPTASLDLAHQQMVIDELRMQAKQGRAILIVIHDLNQAAAIADTIVLMRGGRVVELGRPDAVYTTETLSAVYGCPVCIAAIPSSATPLVYLPGSG